MIKRVLPAALLAAAIISGATAETRSPKNDVSNNLDIFNTIVKELQTFYVDSIDVEKSVQTAINAMLADLDPYTEYYPFDDQESLTSISTGEYGGIGSYLLERANGDVVISEPTVGSPAWNAGLRAGDLLLMVNSDTVRGVGSAAVSSKLKGQAGTNVTVTVDRPYVEDSILTFEITRQTINIPSVPFYGVVRGDIGIINLASFSEKTPDEFRDALLELKKDPRVKAIAIDLRGNGGGVVESAVKVVSNFVPKGTEVLRMRGKGVMNEKIYKTTTPPVDTEIPLVVLIDGGTASASEILAGSLQDIDRAVIVGNRSFGKGLVQTSRQLPYDGMLKVTMAKYYIPSGRLIQAIDYSHRNSDGSVERIPDSLTSVFYTAAGRPVRDGGGITPDTTITYPDVNRLVYNVVRGNWAFDFATKYAAGHPEAAAPSDFVVTDTIFAEFKDFINPDKFEYDKVCEIMVDQLEEVAGAEGYMNDSVRAQIAALRGLLRHDLGNDLDFNRRSISRYIASQLMTRYYGQRGELENSYTDDPGMDAAEAVLRDPARFRAILAPRKEEADRK
ncbi:MAG: S41 family peptidase [Clostridium sp.]|nr:S41 family peptidase [Clostridium sp.]